MKFFKSILAVGAHPDDIEYSCYGFLQRLVSEGAEVVAYVASIGSIGDPTTSKTRLEESYNALAGLTSSIFVNDRVGVIQSDYEAIAIEIRDLIVKTQPSLVLVHSPFDTHQEHRLVSEVTFTASRALPTSLMYYKSVSSTPEFTADFVVDISSVYDSKMRALDMHHSQRGRKYMDPHFMRAFHSDWAYVMRSLDMVESFKVGHLIF